MKRADSRKDMVMMMKKMKLLALLTAAFLLTACGNSDGQSQDQTDTTPISNDTESGVDASAPTISAVEMKQQGNPTSIQLADIMEESGDAYAAWIKISTQFDAELSMYSYDTLAAGTIAIAVDFKVEHFDETESTLYWGYQLTSGGQSYSVWDGTSPADTLTVTEDGTYTIVFDAQKALGGPIEAIESFQLVFPAQSDTTATKVSVTKVRCITDAGDLEYLTTGKAE